MPFDVPGNIEEPRHVTTLAIAATCLGGVVLAVVIGALLWAFVRFAAG